MDTITFGDVMDVLKETENALYDYIAKLQKKAERQLEWEKHYYGSILSRGGKNNEERMAYALDGDGFEIYSKFVQSTMELDESLEYYRFGKRKLDLYQSVIAAAAYASTTDESE
ncbi:MAG: hypothetical protein KatS3mg087_1827 [Patescibacteria group bacterium]|nr:MAG: hypothetical protein KatS3mg087_1827 [Patescibacteria group bacterium]